MIKGLYSMNNENSNNGLNSISLGSVGNIGTTPTSNPPMDNMGADNLNAPVAPIPPAEPINPGLNTIPEPTVNNIVPNNGIIEPTPMTPPTSEPIAPIPDNTNNDGIIGDTPVNSVSPVEPIPPVEPVTPIYDVAETINNFNSAPVFNNIGTVPPINNIPIPNVPIAEPAPTNDDGDKKKKKSGTDKILFVIIVILALTAVGVGVYIFLGLSNNVIPNVKLKNVRLEIGSDISTDINDYATFNGIDSSTCSLDTSSITNTATLDAKYPFTIKCGEKSYSGTVTTVDTVAPIVEVKELTKGVNEDIVVGEFIVSCTDKTRCSYQFKDEEKVKGYLSNTGSYTVDIIATDEANNTTEITAKLNVDGAAASLYLVCTKTTNDYVESNKLGIAETTFVKAAIRTYTFTLNETNYMEFKNDNEGKTEAEYNGIKGEFTLDDNARTLSITKKLSYEELVSEAGSEIPTEYDQLKSFYRGKGYSCRPGI